jgi:hypothetical protein
LATAAVAVILALSIGTPAHAIAPLNDPVFLNIGISCQWQLNCQRRQTKAMLAANRYIAGKNPPLWRIHMCNRNARRSASRADWVGFNACIRNAQLSPPPISRAKSRRR